MNRWIRTRPTPQDTLGAGLMATVLAVGAGLTAFYLTRLFLAREPLEGASVPAPRSEADDVGTGAV